MDILLTYGTPATLVAKKATSKIPIVFAAVADPIVAGIVPTLTRPGGNVTGVTTSNPELSAKRLSLFKEAVPRVSRLVVLGNPAFPPYSDMLEETRVAARSLGVEIHVLEVRTRSELETASKGIGEKKAHGLVILPDPMFISQRRRVVELVATSRLPAIYHLRQFVEVGGLMSYGVSYSESFLQSAALVDKILRGAKPADLPVEQPWHFELIINMKAAKALGLTIPRSVLARADEVIQ